MSSMGHYHAQSDEPLTPEELAQARRLFSDPMALQGSPVFNWIKEYIAVQPCCSTEGAPRSGHANALLLAERASGWYGLGDGSTSDGSLVHNYGGGADGGVHLGALSGETHTGTPGTVGTASGWGLQQDSGSWVGVQKTTQEPGGYDTSPGVYIHEDLHTVDSFTVNAWVLHNGYGISYDLGAGNLKQLGPNPIFGWRAPGNVGVWVHIHGELVIHGAAGDPDPLLGTIELNVGDGTTLVTVNGGLGVADGGWHMISIVIDGTAQTATLYVDGGSSGAGDISAVADVHSVTQAIGFLDYGGFLGSNGGNWGQGFIDEVGVWAGEALTGGDIEDLYGG